MILYRLFKNHISKFETSLGGRLLLAMICNNRIVHLLYPQFLNMVWNLTCPKGGISGWGNPSKRRGGKLWAKTYHLQLDMRGKLEVIPDNRTWPCKAWLTCLPVLTIQYLYSLTPSKGRISDKVINDFDRVNQIIIYKYMQKLKISY